MNCDRWKHFVFGVNFYLCSYRTLTLGHTHTVAEFGSWKKNKKIKIQIEQKDKSQIKVYNAVSKSDNDIKKGIFNIMKLIYEKN